MLRATTEPTPRLQQQHTHNSISILCFLDLQLKCYIQSIQYSEHFVALVFILLVVPEKRRLSGNYKRCIFQKVLATSPQELTPTHLKARKYSVLL